jgi:hypothetical protein
MPNHLGINPKCREKHSESLKIQLADTLTRMHNAIKGDDEDFGAVIKGWDVE